MERLKRIGLDLDTKNRFKLLKAYFNALKFGKVKVYETEHGYHLRIERRTNPEENLKIRLILGDDPERLSYDELKLKLGLNDIIDTLFMAKMNDKGKFIKEIEIDPLTEPFWSKLPCRKVFRNGKKKT